MVILSKTEKNKFLITHPEVLCASPYTCQCWPQPCTGLDREQGTAGDEIRYLGQVPGNPSLRRKFSKFYKSNCHAEC